MVVNLEPLRIGAAVRLLVRDDKTGTEQLVRGRLIALGASAVSIQKGRGASTEWPLANVKRIDVRRRSAGKGALRGAVAGLLAGAVAGFVLGLASGDDPPEAWLGMSAGEKGAFGSVMIGSLGLLVGSLVGATDVGAGWQPVRIPSPTAGVGSRRGLRASLSFSF